jgi:hypothetical protein
MFRFTPHLHNLQISLKVDYLQYLSHSRIVEHDVNWVGIIMRLVQELEPFRDAIGDCDRVQGGIFVLNCFVERAFIFLPTYVSKEIARMHPSP